MDILFGDEADQHVIVNINNGDNLGFSQEVKVDIDFFDHDKENTVKQLVKHAGKEFGLHKEQMKDAKLYNEDGLRLFDNDISLISPGDILYISLAGEDFNYGQILKRYEIPMVRMNREVTLARSI